MGRIGYIMKKSLKLTVTRILTLVILLGATILPLLPIAIPFVDEDNIVSAGGGSGSIGTIRVNSVDRDSSQVEADGTYDHNIASLSMGRRASGDAISAAFVFTGITIPADCTILSAKITFTASSTITSTTGALTIKGEDTATPADYGAAEDFTARTYTTASVSWTPASTWTAESTYDTADITSIVAELYASYTPYAAEDMAFEVLGLAGSAALTRKVAYSYDGSAAKAPLLVITYSPNDVYWVGASGNWSDATAHWATSTGGAPGAANLPSSYTNVHFDANSGFTSGSKTVTLTADAYCNDMDWTGAPSSPYLNASSNTLVISGSLTLVAGMTFGNGANPSLKFVSVDSETITTNGVTLDFGGTYDVQFYSSGLGSGTWTLQDNLTVAYGIELLGGHLDFNDKDVTLSAGRLFLELSTHKELSLGTGTITFLSTSDFTVDDTIDPAECTINAETSTLVFSGSGGLGNGDTNYPVTLYDVEMTGTSHLISTSSVASYWTFHDLTRTGTASKYCDLEFNYSPTITGTFTVNGNSATNRMLVHSYTEGTYITITAATVSASNVDFLDIQGAGAASWDLSAITGGSGNAGHNAGITFTTPANCYWVDNSGEWSDIAHWASTSGGVAGSVRVPLVQDNAIFDANSITMDSRVVELDMPRTGNIDLENVINTPQFDGDGAGAGSIYLYGDVVLGTINWTPATTYLYGRGTQNITSNSATFDCDIYSFNYGAVVQLEDDAILSDTENWYLRAGTFNLNKQDLTLGCFNSSTTTDTRSLVWGDATEGGTIEVHGTTNAWYMATANFTMGENKGTLKIHGDSAVARNVYMAGITTYNNVIVSGSGAYTLTLTSAGFTCNIFYIDRSEATKTISGNFTITANTGIYIPVNGVTMVTIANTDWSTAAGNIISVDYVAFSGGANTSTASATGTWYAGTHSTGSPQTNWQFVGTTAPVFTTDAASDITTTDAILHATVTSLGSWTNGVYISFDYGMTVVYSDGPTAEGAVVLAVPTTIDIPITSLNPLVDYHFRAIARYNYLDYSYGADRTFYSDESVPEPVPGAPLASGLSSLTGEDLPPVDILDQTTEEDMYALTAAASLSGLFGYDFIHSVAVAMTTGGVGSGYAIANVEMQLWYAATGFILLIIVMGLLILIPGHQMISGLGGVAFLGLATSVNIYPWWVVFVGVIYLLATIAAERSSLSG